MAQSIEERRKKNREVTRIRYARSPELRKKASEAARIRYARNSEQIREACKAWRARNPEKVREANKAWRARNPEYGRASYMRDPRKHRERSKAWAARNREQTRERSRSWRARNPDKASGPQAKRRSADLERQRVYGLTPAAYDDLVLSSYGRCPRCSRVDDDSRQGSLGVEHQHLPGPVRPEQVRGLACGDCNQGIRLVEQGHITHAWLDNIDLYLAGREGVSTPRTLLRRSSSPAEANGNGSHRAPSDATEQLTFPLVRRTFLPPNEIPR